MTKVCIDPGCEEVPHNIEKKETRCRTCNGILVRINAETFEKKFAQNFFQFNYATGDQIKPILKPQLTLNL